MSPGTSICLVIVGILVATACLFYAAIIDAAAASGRQDKEREMNKRTIAVRLATRLERAAPSAMPKSTMGIPGGHINWDEFAEAIVDALQELMNADTQRQTEADDGEVHLTRIVSGKGGPDV